MSSTPRPAGPAAGLRIELYRLDGGARELLTRSRTNADGRCDGPLLQGAELDAGQYELRVPCRRLSARRRRRSCPSPPFLDLVPIRFGIAAADQHYHVPLLVSPYAYSTYRGS